MVKKSSKADEPISFLTKSFSASDLMGLVLPKLSYVVDGIIPEGLTLLIAAPKVGKSWMVLGIANAVAKGEPALGGIPTRKAPILYLALEDGKRRLQSRYAIIDPGFTPGTVPRNLRFQIEAKRDDILDTIREFIELHPGEAPLVILDTLGKVMPKQEKGETLYDRDYRIGAELKAITDRHPGSAVVVVHHTRKAVTADFTESSSGTNGLTGSADTIIVLRRNRQEVTGTLHVTSRDAREGEYQVKFGEDARWTLDGGSLRAAAQASATSERQGQLGARSIEVIDYVHAHPAGVGAQQVADGLGLDVAAARTYLSRAFDSGNIFKVRRGVYGPFPSPDAQIITVDFTGVKFKPHTRQAQEK